MSRERILVVEDENIVALDIQRGLRNLGFEVPAIARNGRDALRLIEEFAPQLVLMDIKLQEDLDGIETAKIIRDRWGTPVIFLTANADAATLERAKAVDSFGYVLKPFDERDLHTTIDIALAKQRQHVNELARNEERFRLVLEAVKDYAIIMVDPGGVISSWNVGAQRIYGYRGEEVIGRHVSILAGGPAQFEHCATELSLALREGRYETQDRHVRRDGTVFWVELVVTALKELNGKHQGFVKISRDITDRKKTEDQILYQSSVLKVVADNAVSCLFMMNKQGCPTFMNPAAEQVTGFKLEEIDTRPLHYSIHHHRPDGSFYPMDECPIDRSQHEFAARRNEEETYIRKDGSLFPVSFSLSPLRQGDEIVGSVLEFRDITEEKKAENALRQAISARDEFISIASHELKTPITSMKLRIENILRMTVPEISAMEPGRLIKILHQTHRQMERLTKLVEDMLDNSRLGEGKLKLEKVRLDLGELVRDVAERFREQLAAAGITPRFLVDPDVIGHWDRDRLEQVVTNLLDNAIKYAPGHPVELRVEKKDGLASVTVTDHGIGISEDATQRIFERFERAVPYTNVSGLGLGLYISSQIVELHQGKISVASKDGEGASFSIELPLG